MKTSTFSQYHYQAMCMFNVFYDTSFFSKAFQVPFKNSVEGKSQHRLVFKNHDKNMTESIRWRWWQPEFLSYGHKKNMPLSP